MMSSSIEVASRYVHITLRRDRDRARGGAAAPLRFRKDMRLLAAVLLVLPTVVAFSSMPFTETPVVEAAPPSGPPPCEDVDTSEWPAEWAPLIGLGGGAAPGSDTVRDYGIMCDTDLATSIASALMPGIFGSLCDYCSASCAAVGELVCNCI